MGLLLSPVRKRFHVKLFSELTLAMSHADAHDRAIHGTPPSASLFKNEIVR